MAATFRPDLSDDVSWARQRLADNLTTGDLVGGVYTVSPAHFEDETIAAAIAEEGRYLGVKQLAVDLIVKLGQEATKLDQEGHGTEEYSDRIEALETLCTEMDRKAKNVSQEGVQRGPRVGRMKNPKEVPFRF